MPNILIYILAIWGALAFLLAGAWVLIRRFDFRMQAETTYTIHSLDEPPGEPDLDVGNPILDSMLREGWRLPC